MLFRSERQVVRAWDIQGFPNYFFGSDKLLYRIDRQGRLHQNKLIMVGYSKGYVLKSKFFSLTKLRPLLKKHVPSSPIPLLDVPTQS